MASFLVSSCYKTFIEENRRPGGGDDRVQSDMGSVETYRSDHEASCAYVLSGLQNE